MRSKMLIVTLCLVATPVVAAPTAPTAGQKMQVLSLVQEPNGQDPEVIAKLKALQVENSKLHDEVARRGMELKAVQVALANAETRARSAEEALKKFDADVATRGGGVAPFVDTRKGFPDINNMIALAETDGDAVFFNGVGEARMATNGEFTVLRFPHALVGRADVLLMNRGASKQTRGQFTYYVLASKLLAF